MIRGLHKATTPVTARPIRYHTKRVWSLLVARRSGDK